VSQVEELGGNRVRLTVEVAPADVHHAYEHALRDLSASVRIPGFRPGKAPLPVVVSRLGKERVWAEAVDSHIGGWFWNAAMRKRLRPVGQPDYEYSLPERDDAPWSFTATVEVQPPPKLVDWRQLEVPRAEVEVPEAAIAAELEALQASVAELVPVDGRGAQQGDAVVVDLISPEGEAQRDVVVEVGAGRLVDEVEEALTGTTEGETRTVTYELADGSKATVEVVVKEIREKLLPPLDDDLARAASEFDTLAELRADVEQRLREQIEAEVDAAFRAAAVDRLAIESRVQPAAPLVQQRARDLLTGFVRSLERRGITTETYFAMTGRDPRELERQMMVEAAASVARELTLEALAHEMGIEVTDDEIRELIREQAEAAGDDPEQVIADIWSHGRHEELREDLRLKAALDRLVQEVKPISVEQAEAREKLWTPDKEKQGVGQKLWTPGS
jgi:trigger factor